MTPEQLDAVARSVVAVRANADRFSRTFYERMFTRLPDARALFPEDLAEQRGKLVNELAFLAEAAQDMPAFVERARELGARHRRYGVRPADYPVVAEALFEAFAAVLGPDFDNDLAAAWRRLYSLIAETMLEGAAGSTFAGQH